MKIFQLTQGFIDGEQYDGYSLDDIKKGELEPRRCFGSVEAAKAAAEIDHADAFEEEDDTREDFGRAKIPYAGLRWLHAKGDTLEAEGQHPGILYRISPVEVESIPFS